MRSLLTIGLTGGYASGKSQVGVLLRELGAVVIDADELAHAAIARNTPAWREIVAHFGQDILRPNGEIDRAALGKLVFAQPTQRQKLEQIVHPRVIDAMRAERARAGEQGADVFVGEVPLLFESGLAGEFDRVWVVSVADETSIARAVRRDKLSPAEARRRLASQWPLAEKERRADLVLRNDGDLAALRRQVNEAWLKLKDRNHGR